MVAGVLIFLTRPPMETPPPDTGKVTLPAPAFPGKVIAVIIDDFGYSTKAAEPFIEMPLPVALSFLPGLPHSRKLAQEALGKGKTLLLHLPMEPLGYPQTDPGPGAVLTSQEREEILRILEEDLASLPEVAGVNNHMGSKATADGRVMETVLNLLKEKGLFFIDSRTTAKTVAFSLAREMGIPSAERSVFLDNVKDSEAIDARLEELLDLAEERGWAVGIGHPYPLTAEAMSRLAFKARERGVNWITIENLIAYADSGNRDILR